MYVLEVCMLSYKVAAFRSARFFARRIVSRVGVHTCSCCIPILGHGTIMWKSDVNLGVIRLALHYHRHCVNISEKDVPANVIWVVRFVNTNRSSFRATSTRWQRKHRAKVFHYIPLCFLFQGSQFESSWKFPNELCAKETSISWTATTRENVHHRKHMVSY